MIPRFHLINWKNGIARYYEREGNRETSVEKEIKNLAQQCGVSSKS